MANQAFKMLKILCKKGLLSGTLRKVQIMSPCFFKHCSAISVLFVSHTPQTDLALCRNASLTLAVCGHTLVNSFKSW